MATRGSNGHGLADAARDVAEHASALARLELRLALTEVRRKARRVGIGAGLLVGAALVGGFGVTIGIAAGIAAIALALPVWLALLVVGGFLLLLSGLLGVVGLGLVKRGTPPVPEAAIEEARLTTEALKNGSH